ncbi:MAG TPA: alpha/beta hydrolase [Coleofasciculaceae cyanobacterium]
MNRAKLSNPNPFTVQGKAPTSQPQYPIPSDFRLEQSNPKTQNLGLRLRTLPFGVSIALLNLGLLIAPVVIPSPAQGAERIYVPFGPIEFSLPIASLERFAKEGKIDRALGAYTDYLTPEQLQQLREILITRVDVTPVAIAQFLYSAQGKQILARLGQVIETKAGQDGFYAIRAALIQAAAHPEGFTLLNVLREFPTYGIRINSQRGFQIFDGLTDLIQQTEMAISAVERKATVEAAQQTEYSFAGQPGASFALEQNLQQPGPIRYSKQTLTLTDLRRVRTFPVDLYLPQLGERPVPVIVISHGLGSDRQTFGYLATHLASYGFAVAVPEHPGSNADQIQALLNGLANEVTPPQELLDRPLDIKFLLDELERSFKGQLNLQQVGVIGQSFGGYTALALAGAGINLQQLQQECPKTQSSFNLSLLLQCLANGLPAEQYKLRDERIQAAIAINPIGSTIFGESQFQQIQTPLMLVAGSDDTVAPALAEQIQPFTWLTTPNKYLVLLRGGTHFSTLEESSGGVPVPSQAIGPDPRVAQGYMKALSLAFFETYIAGNSKYQPYLSSSYAQFLSRDPIPLSLIQSLTTEQLNQVSEPTPPEPTPTPQQTTPPALLLIPQPNP